MQSPSSFQLLTPCIVKSIIDYITCDHNVFNVGLKSESERREKLLIPLLSVCQNFRNNVHMRYCKTFRLVLSMSLDRAVAILTSWPECLQGIEYPTNHLASWLDIQLSVWSIMTGHALELLLCEPCDGCPFPKVCTVSLILSSDEYGDSTEDNLSEIDVNVSAFVVRLSAMAPMANEIRLEGGRITRNLSLTDSEQMVRSYE
ncbi:hypothetical protein GGI09_000820 [Coemansia sp. S100]|nr:hypothetical protein GGI09_000820 [Coemansia sp. S100]